MLSEIAVRLIQGEFICKFTNSSMFNELAKDDERTKNSIEAFLSVADRTLQINDRGTAYFAAHAPEAIGAKDEARKIFERLRERIRPTLSFLQLMASISTKDDESSVFIQGGELLSISEIIAGLEHNQVHLADLDRLIWVKKKDDPLSVKVRHLFKELEKEGLLMLQNPKLERYIVTGKTDAIQDAMAFIAEMEGLIVNNVEPLSELQTELSL
jgi:hypothetical protein